MKEVYIVSAKRTAIGNFSGTIAPVAAPQLGATVISAIVKENAIPVSAVDEVIMGQVLQAGSGQNPARQAAISADLSEETPTLTINKVCGSGMKALHLAAQAINNGDADIIIAGGQENMSQAPYLLPKARDGYRLGDQQVQDVILRDGLTCALNKHMHMGITAENLAKKYNISREAQDAFAASSQQKASAAQQAGAFDKEIVAVHIPQRRGDDIVFDKDEFIRHNATKEALTKLRPAFDKEGSVTAGNASGINDGAAALLVVSSAALEKHNLTPIAKVVAFASAGVDPTIMGIGPVPATEKCLSKAGWSLDDVDLIESNEAFAAQSLSVMQEAQFDPEKTNVNGGAIALGHPIGASGARILVTLVHALQARGKRKGIATMCIGGGQGIATAIELV